MRGKPRSVPAHPAWREVIGILELVLLALLLNCTPTPAKFNAAPREFKVPALRTSNLPDYVPAAGLRWMLIGSPKQLLSDLSPEIGKLLPAARLAAFRQNSGVDLASTDHGLIAGFDGSILYMFSFEGNRATTTRFLSRALGEPLISRPHPSITRVRAKVGGVRQTLVQLDRHLFALAEGEEMPARVVELYAQGRLKSPTALTGTALRELPMDATDCAARLYVPGPINGQRQASTLQLIGALGLCVNVDKQALTTRLYIRGAWPERGEQVIGQLYEELTRSTLGELLGLDEPYELTRDGELIVISTKLDKSRVLSGVYAAVRGNVEDLFQLPQRSAGTADPLPPL